MKFIDSDGKEKEILILEAEDINDKKWNDVIKCLKENCKNFEGVRYANGNYMNLIFKE